MDFKNMIASLFFGLIGSVAFVSIYNQVYQKSFAVVRMDKIVANHLNEYGKRELGKEEQSMAAAKFAKVLEFTINEVSQNEKVILLVAPAVVTKLPDYTSRVEQEIEKNMRESR